MHGHAMLGCARPVATCQSPSRAINQQHNAADEQTDKKQTKHLHQNKPGLNFPLFRRIEGCGKHIFGRGPCPCTFELRVADLARVWIIELDFARPGLSPPKMFKLWQSTNCQGANYQGDTVIDKSAITATRITGEFHLLHRRNRRVPWQRHV
jgi:hypothetical protein